MHKLCEQMCGDAHLYIWKKALKAVNGVFLRSYANEEKTRIYTDRVVSGDSDYRAAYVDAAAFFVKGGGGGQRRGVYAAAKALGRDF